MACLCRRKDVFDPKNKMVCSKHFEVDEYEEKFKLVFIIKQQFLDIWLQSSQKRHFFIHFD